MTRIPRPLLAVCALLLLAGVTRAGAAGVQFTNIVSFTGANGAQPYPTLIQGADGFLYGTTLSYNSSPYGSVFKVALDGTQFHTVAQFTGANGEEPFGGLTQTADGTIYGTTASGTSGPGTVFKITTNGTLTTIVTFNSTNGANPRAAMLAAPDGYLYGTTVSGGSSSLGTVFRLNPTNGALTTLVSFKSTNGSNPYGGLVQTADGTFYGTTSAGGAVGKGSVFSLNTNGVLTTLFSFAMTNGATPYAPLVQAADGNLYGTTTAGGSFNVGTIFRITTNGALTTLVNFNHTNGASASYGALITGPGGVLYGTAGGGTNSYGEVYQLTTNGVITPLFSFTIALGTDLEGGLLLATNGALYGATEVSSPGDGNIYRLIVPGATNAPPPAPQITAVSQGAGGLVISWQAVSGDSYQVQYLSSLDQSNWTNLGGAIVATNTVMTYTDAAPPYPQRFYRVEALPSQ